MTVSIDLIDFGMDVDGRKFKKADQLT